MDAPSALNERFQKLAGIKPLYEQGFDDRLKSAMGMSDDEFEDEITSRDPESPFPGPDSSSNGYQEARKLIDQIYKENCKCANTNYTSIINILNAMSIGFYIQCVICCM